MEINNTRADRLPTQARQRFTPVKARPAFIGVEPGETLERDPVRLKPSRH
jgi:hypothetical protein